MGTTRNKSNTKSNTRQRARFRVQFTEDDHVRDLCTTVSLQTAIDKARKHMMLSGQRTWVWNTTNGFTVFRATPAVQVAGGGVQ